MINFTYDGYGWTAGGSGDSGGGGGNHSKDPFTILFTLIQTIISSLFNDVITKFLKDIACFLVDGNYII